jgi:hypothetical protein
MVGRNVADLIFYRGNRLADADGIGRGQDAGEDLLVLTEIPADDGNR